MINHPKSSLILGNVILWLGIVPIVIWVLDYVNIVRPGKDPSEWGILVFCAGLIAIGSLLIKGEGDSVADVFVNLKKKLNGS